jgi:trans-aconitate 2-methyltransferase
MPAMSWSAAQYVKFEDERTRPARDLVARIPNGVVGAADIGCGPGNSTEVLQARYPDAQILGLDSSPDMIDAARKRLPGIAFEVADIRHWRPEQRFDVILANAVLQWIPGHETLMPALIARLNPGGALAVQTPDNLDEPSHRLMREIAGAGPWAAKLKDAAKARAARHDATWYFRLLRVHASHVDIWRTTYHHPLAGAHAVVEWVKGTGLRPFIDPLDENEREAYLARYEAAIAEAYPAEVDGTVLLPFPRLFFVATR